ESVHSVIAALKHSFIPAILGKDPRNIQQIHQLMDAELVLNGAAKAAIDIACYDILGKTSNLPIYALLVGKKSTRTMITEVLSIMEPDILDEKEKEAIKEGYAEVKMKISTNPQKDIERVKAVREAVGSDCFIRVDVNQGWKTVQVAKE